jgi:hypothetical protein
MVPDLGAGNQVKDRIDHAQPRAQDRNQADAVLQNPAACDSERRSYTGRLCLQVLRRFVRQQDGQPLNHSPETAGVDAAISQAHEMVLNKGVIDDKNVLHARPPGHIYIFGN